MGLKGLLGNKPRPRPNKLQAQTMKPGYVEWELPFESRNIVRLLWMFISGKGENFSRKDLSPAACLPTVRWAVLLAKDQNRSLVFLLTVQQCRFFAAR
jgi:hypothetical protein